MRPQIDPEFAALIPPTPLAERTALEASLVRAGGAEDALITWRGLLVDGHTRLEICERLGLRYDTREIDLPDRAAVKAWILENQCARRNLSVFQRITLAAKHGAARPAFAEQSDWKLALEAVAAGLADDILAGHYTTYQQVRYRVHPPAKRPPRGPSAKPPIPEGHELQGLSTLTDLQTGEAKAEWAKTRPAGADEPPTPIPENFLLKRASVMQRADGTTVIQWSSYEPEKQAQFEAIKAAVVDHVATYIRNGNVEAPAPAPAITDADLLVAYPLGDPHIGMLAWADEVGGLAGHFDLRIAERELCECMVQLVARAPAAAEAIVVNLGDFWHAEDDRQATPKSGHKLDVDGRAGKVGRVGLAILRRLVDTALTKHARVRVRSIPGNHDPHSSFWIPEVMRALYANEPRVVVEDGFNPYQFDTWGKVLLGWAHGDGAKLEALGEIMATDAPEMWGASSFRYWNTGHVHHWSEKELRGCVVTTHRTLAGRDAWHHHSGYRSGRALKALAYHREWGLDSVAVVGVERVRAAIEAQRRAA